MTRSLTTIVNTTVVKMRQNCGLFLLHSPLLTAVITALVFAHFFHRRFFILQGFQFIQFAGMTPQGVACQTLGGNITFLKTSIS